MGLEGYLKYRRAWEAGLWVAFFAVHTVVNTTVVWFDVQRVEAGHALWELITWETTSALVTLALIPALLTFDRWFPFRRHTFGTSFLAHLLFTVPWSVVHSLGMVGMRKLVYWFRGEVYTFDPWIDGLFYEFLKDIRGYFFLLALVYLYRFVIRRLQGEAQFVPEGDSEAPRTPEPAEPDRILVKKLGREFLVRVEDIDWLEAAGNYVTLHVGDRNYLLRETMSGIERRFSGKGFARVHRSAIVNLDRVTEIEPFDTGDARAHLVSGDCVPVSRRYRQTLKERLAT